jgi:hypothetical protein
VRCERLREAHTWDGEIRRDHLSYGSLGNPSATFFFFPSPPSRCCPLDSFRDELCFLLPARRCSISMFKMSFPSLPPHRKQREGRCSLLRHGPTFDTCGTGQDYKKKNSTISVGERTVPTERPQLVGEVIANFCALRVPCGHRDGSLRPYSRFSRQEPLLFYQVAPQLYSRG